MRDAYLGMPVISTFVLVMGAGYIIGGIRSCIIVGALILFIALSEYWNRALITAYMATFAVGVSAILGIVTGSICARNEISAKFILAVCDFFQTFPSFIYLIPVILLFGITDTSVMIAAIAYASVPATRYTVEGLRSVPSSLHDAASMSGVSNFQRWKSIELPLAFPHIMLGINQTLIFALMMIVLGALIGTEDLGQIIMGCLSRPNGAGIGLTLGIFVSFICLAADNLIRTWADERKKMLMTNYSFFSSILNEKIFSPSRWYIADGTDYPLKDNKYFGNYKKLLIELIKNKEIAVIYTVYPADRSTLYTYIDKSCFNEIKISKILNSFEIKDCYEIKN